MPDDGFVIDRSRWRSSTVDPGKRIAEAEGGCLLMDLDTTTAAHGLAAPSGTFFDTGVGGLTLGGGISHIIEWGRRAARLFEPNSGSGGGYLNYPEVDETAARVAPAFGPERFAKLREIKRTWDPDNRFRHNADIVPA